MARKKIDLLFSDTSMGHPDLGFMARPQRVSSDDEDAGDDEDAAFRSFVMRTKPELREKNVRVTEGAVWLDSE